MVSTSIDPYQQQSYSLLLQGKYDQAAQLYEQAIDIEPDIISNYWYLGLLLLLQGKEAEAQTTWLVAMAEGEPEEIERWAAELADILHAEAERQEQLTNYQLAWTIRQHLREINPQDINNILFIIHLSIKLENFQVTSLNDLGVFELLKENSNVDQDLLLHVLKQILNYALQDELIDAFTALCLNCAENSSEFIDTIMGAAIDIAYARNAPRLASKLAEICLNKNPDSQQILRHLAAFYQNAGEYEKGIKIAKYCYELSQSLLDKIHNNHILIRGLLSIPNYEGEAYARLEHHQKLLIDLINQFQHKVNYEEITQSDTLRLFASTFFLSYFQDTPETNQSLRNQIASLCQKNIENYAQATISKYRSKAASTPIVKSNKVLKIGYLSHCLKQHSVGWLCRWLFKYHNPDNFHIYGYATNSYALTDFSERWFANSFKRFYGFKNSGAEVLDQIRQDEIDILVDLDSITFDATCELMAVKAAPIQLTWLGWDASGIPSIDYYIADPYVLPENAQEYYSEKIWRLPHTYIAVDGFEVATPTLRRDLLGIPNDAVIYYMGQRSYKLNLAHIRLQMQILKEVPNSYLLIKARGDQEGIKQFFRQIAEEVGVNPNCICFIPQDISEEVHRANLGIADVVLDTYPYNGATTTLETLWMGIPLVTRVGQQFAARNSYGMMMNVGITEGIAWSDEEYVEWGVRLGKDPALRQQISLRLRQSRQTSPLWNSAQFTREMERGYQQMWENYIK